MSVRESGRNRRGRGGRGAPAGPTTCPLALPFDECGHMHVKNMLVHVLVFFHDTRMEWGEKGDMHVIKEKLECSE